MSDTIIVRLRVRHKNWLKHIEIKKALQLTEDELLEKSNFDLAKSLTNTFYSKKRKVA